MINREELIKKCRVIMAVLNSVELPVAYGILCVSLDNMASQMGISTKELMQIIAEMSETVADTMGPIPKFTATANVVIKEVSND